VKKDNQTLTFEEVYEKICSYITDKNEQEIISNAYLFAYEKHLGQKRLTGEDYILHPLNVADILSDINVDAETICSGLLHDVIAECDVSVEEIEQKFGKEIAKLTNGVNKINRLRLTCENESVIENHKKILVGLSEDVRILFIKMADRLHNMRTLWILSAESQKATAKETLDILVPIASRLGMHQIKSELEDLSLRYFKSDVYFSIVEKLNQTKKERDHIIEKMITDVTELLTSNGIKCELKGRAKSIFSIYKKLDAGREFSDIYDLLALRIFVETEHECYQALGIIHAKFRSIPKRFRDYIAMPKANMYQSLHTTVFGLDGYFFEIQIRTKEMDKIAERGIASHWSYKEKTTANNIKQDAMEQKLEFFREIIDLNETGMTDADFVSAVQNNFIITSIFVFTPNGDVIELPNGSTPIDFAYRVHSDIGDTMVGALVNESIVSLDYVLKDGDIIKINTNKNSLGPSREWIDMAFTNKAKDKIRSFYNKTDKEEYLTQGTEMLHKELRKQKIPFDNFYSEKSVEKVLKELRIGDINELHINIGSGKLTTIQVINALNTEWRPKEEIVIERVANTTVKTYTGKNDIIIEGIDDLKVNVAACCKPIPGDEIVGYISKGHGINIHRIICPNVSDLEERVIEANWNESIVDKYVTDLLIKVEDIKNILLSIISKTSTSDITVQNVNTNNVDNTVNINLSLLLTNKERLDKFINEILSIDGVITVERYIK